MDLDYLLEDIDPSGLAFIPGFTNNKKGLKKFIGVVLITSVLNQSFFIFDSNITATFSQYFILGGQSYDSQYVRSCWVSTQLVSSLLSLLIITKVQPIQYFGILSIIFGISQFVLAFFSPDKLYGYSTVVGAAGGVASGSVLVVPLYILWRSFVPRLKGYVIAAFFLCTGFLNRVIFYFLLRSVWWGQAYFPKGELVEK